MAGTPQGVTPGWRRMVRAGLPSGAFELLDPLFGAGTSNLPQCLTPSVSVRDADFDTHLDEVVTAATAHFAEQVETLHGPAPAPHWRTAMRRPQRWIGTYAATLRAVWRAFQPVWRSAQTLLERETARVGVACVSGTLDVLLTDLNPRWRFAGRTLTIPSRTEEHIPLDGRLLVLTPTVSGAGSSVFDPDLDDLVWLGYPIPGLETLWQPDGRSAPPDALALMLGPVRAKLLRAARVPQPMQTLARMAGLTPNLATYHCGRMVDAGLLYRRRRGRRVYMGRTARGDALLDLLTGPI
jgi:hypothetical protein